MKRVLVIADDYPPRPGVGGIRPAALAKYLPEFGWETVILTPELPPGKGSGACVIETGYQDVLGTWKARVRMNPNRGLHEQLNLRQSSKPGSQRWNTKVIRWLRSWLIYPDQFRGWLPFGRDAIRHLAQRVQVDAIVSTAPPLSSHLLGAEAKNILHCPWVADCRDMPEAADSGSRFLQKRLAALERKKLRQADALVTVSSPWADHLRQQYPCKPVFGITNGFEPEDFADKSGELTKLLTITYTGELYLGRRDPTPLFEALEQLFNRGVIPREQIRVRFFSPPEPWLTAAAERYHLQGVVEECGWAPREEALRHQRESQLLLLLGLDAPIYSGGIPGKLFEYLAAARPIVAFGGERGVVEELLAETGAGRFLPGKLELCDFLTRAFEEFRTTGRVSYQGSQAVIDRYSHREMVRKFAQVLDSIEVDGGSAPPIAVSGTR